MRRKRVSEVSLFCICIVCLTKIINRVSGRERRADSNTKARVLIFNQVMSAPTPPLLANLHWMQNVASMLHTSKKTSSPSQSQSLTQVRINQSMENFELEHTWMYQLWFKYFWAWCLNLSIVSLVYLVLISRISMVYATDCSKFVLTLDQTREDANTQCPTKVTSYKAATVTLTQNPPWLLRLCSDKQWVIFSGEMVFCQSWRHGRIVPLRRRESLKIGKYFDGAGLYCFYWLRHENRKYESRLKWN